MKHIDCNPISPEFRNYKPKLNSKHQLISNLSFEKLKSNLTTNVEPDKNLKLKNYLTTNVEPDLVEPDKVEPDLNLSKIFYAYKGYIIGDLIYLLYDKYDLAICEKMIINKNTIIQNKKGSIGQCSEYVILINYLIKYIMKMKKFDENDLYLLYLEYIKNNHIYYNSELKKLFSGLKTVRGYKNRYKTLDINNSDETLNRAFPYILLKYINPEYMYHIIETDVRCSNRNEYNIEIQKLYLKILEAIIDEKISIFFLRELDIQNIDIKNILTIAIDEEYNSENIQKFKSIKILYAFYICIYSLVCALNGERNIFNILYKIKDANKYFSIVSCLLSIYLQSKNIDNIFNICINSNYIDSKIEYDKNYHPINIINFFL